VTFPATRADLILEMLDHILEGGVPHPHDVLLLRDYVLSGVQQHGSLYTPHDLWQQLHSVAMEVRVRASEQRAGAVQAVCRRG